MMTSTDCMIAAFAAIVREDYAERDRLCDEARRMISVERMAAEADAAQRVMAVDFYVMAEGTVVPTKRMAQAAGVI